MDEIVILEYENDAGKNVYSNWAGYKKNRFFRSFSG